jgi:hypothetical protein
MDTLQEHCPPDLVTGQIHVATPINTQQATGGEQLRKLGKVLKDLKEWLSNTMSSLLF